MYLYRCLSPVMRLIIDLPDLDPVFPRFGRTIPIPGPYPSASSAKVQKPASIKTLRSINWFLHIHLTS